MDVTHILVTTLDCDGEVVEEFNRWLDLNRLPAVVALPGVLSGRRYVATPELQALRGADPAEAFAAGRSSFCTILYVSTDDLTGVLAGLRALPAALAKAGRTFPAERQALRFTEAFRLEWAVARAGLRADERDIPFLGHTGVQVAIGEVPDASARAAVGDWYRAFHGPDMATVPGVLACLRGASVETPGRYLALFLLDEAPGPTIERVHAAVLEWRRQGRSPSPGQALQHVVHGPFRLITPLRYDFALKG